MWYCPRCSAPVDFDAVGCKSCSANISGDPDWKPVAEAAGLAPEVTASAGGMAFLCFAAMLLTLLFGAGSVASCWGGCSAGLGLIILFLLVGSAWLIVQAARHATHVSVGGKVLIYCILVPYSLLTFPALAMAVISLIATAGGYIQRNVF
jgi:hypothetical protein